jgi:chemotaxis protein MotB
VRAQARSLGGRRRVAEDRPVSQDRWVVSYADFITLLFAFFTTLYAISNVDLQKMHRLVSALQVAFDTKAVKVDPAKSEAPPLGPTAEPDALENRLATATVAVGREDLAKLPPKMLDEIGRGYLEASLDDVRNRLGRTLAPAVADGRVSLEIDRRGLVISIRETGTFRMGSADLSDTMRGLIGEVGAALHGVDNFVRVEGHTDDIPIHTTRYASNWDLSTARATAVVAFLVQEFGIPSDRLSAAGYAEFHPKVPNTSEGNRSRNRRVDIVILNQTTTEAEEPVSAAAR